MVKVMQIDFNVDKSILHYFSDKKQLLNNISNKIHIYGYVRSKSWNNNSNNMNIYLSLKDVSYAEEIIKILEKYGKINSANIFDDPYIEIKYIPFDNDSDLRKIEEKIEKEYMKKYDLKYSEIEEVDFDFENREITICGYNWHSDLNKIISVIEKYGNIIYDNERYIN